MVALPTSSASRTGGAQQALQQEQRAESAKVNALPPPRPASTSPPQIKVEVGVSYGSTTSIDEGSLSSSVLGIGRVAHTSSVCLSALEDNRRAAECELLLLWLRNRRLDLTVVDTETNRHSRRVLDDHFKSAWYQTDWDRAGSVEAGYMRSLDSYENRLEEIKFRGRLRRDFPASVRHLDQELKSVDWIKAYILLDDRRSELELAKQLTDRQIALKAKADQENLCSTCAPDLSPQGSSNGERAGTGDRQTAAAHPAQVPSPRRTQDAAPASRFGQAAVSQAALRLRAASLASLEAEVAARRRRFQCYSCIEAKFDSIISKLECLKSALVETSAASPSHARGGESEMANDSPSTIDLRLPATATGNALSHADSTVCSKLGSMTPDAVLAHSHRHPGDTTARAACSDEVTVSVEREAQVGDSSQQSGLSSDEVVSLGQPCVILPSIYGLSSGGVRHGIARSLPGPDLVFGDVLPGDILTCTATNINPAPIQQAIRTRPSTSSPTGPSPDSKVISLSACAEQSLAASAGIGTRTITFGTLAKPSLDLFPARIARDVSSPLWQPHSHTSRAFQFSERSSVEKRARTVTFKSVATILSPAAMWSGVALPAPSASVLGHDLAVLGPTGPGPPCMPATAHGELLPLRQGSGFACIQRQEPATNQSCPRSETRRGINAISQAPNVFPFQDSCVCVAATLRGIRIPEMFSESQQSRIDSVHHPCVGVPDISVVMHICIDGFQAESAMAQNAETISPTTNFTSHQWSSGDGDHSQMVTRSPSYVVGNMHEQQAHQRAGDGVAQRAAVAVCKSPLSSSTRMEVEVAKCNSQTLPVEAPLHPVSPSPISSIGGGSAQQDGGVCHRCVSPLAPYCQYSVTDSCLLLLVTFGLPLFESSLPPLPAKRSAARCEVAPALVGVMQMRREHGDRAWVRTSQERSVPEGVVRQKGMHESAEGAIQEGVARPAALDEARKRQVSATAASVSAGMLSVDGVHSMHAAAHRSQTPTFVPPLSRPGELLPRSLQDCDYTRRRFNQEGVNLKAVGQGTLVWHRMSWALMEEMVIIREATKQEGVVCDLAMVWEQAATFRDVVIGGVELDKESGDLASSSTQVAFLTTVTASLASPTAQAPATRPQWAFFDSIASGADLVQCDGSDGMAGDSKAHLVLTLATEANSRAGFAQAYTHKGATHSSAVTQQSKRNFGAGLPESFRYSSRFCGPKLSVLNTNGHPSARISLTVPPASSAAGPPPVTVVRDERTTRLGTVVDFRLIDLPGSKIVHWHGSHKQIRTRELNSMGRSSWWYVGMCYELEVEVLGQKWTESGLLLREHVAVSKRGADCVRENGQQTFEDLTTTTRYSCAGIDSRPRTEDLKLTGQLDHARQYRSISHQWTLLVFIWVCLVKQVLLAVMHEALGMGQGLDMEHTGDKRNTSRRQVIHPQCTGHYSSPSYGRRPATTLGHRHIIRAIDHSVLWGLGAIRLIWELGFRWRSRRNDGSGTGYLCAVIRMS